MKTKTAIYITAVLTALSLGSSAVAASIPALVTFDPPAVPQGPSIYIAVPGPQTITTAPATFTGGAVLGFATFFPAIAFASVPNVYGTANFGNHLADTLTISVDPVFAANEISFALFNGETFAQSYTVDAFNGSNLVASQTLADVAPNFNSGYGLIDLNALGGITSVTIAPNGAPAAWDFLIDTVAFNQSITAVVNAPPPPVVQPAAPPVQGHRHGQGEGETELLEVDFGDDVNDIRGSSLVVTPADVTPTAPEPGTWLLLVSGVLAFGAVQRMRKAA